MKPNMGEAKKKKNPNLEDILNYKPKIGVFKKIVLALPLFLSITWISFLVYNRTPAGTGMLSPDEITPLILTLIAFTIGYLIFLLLMFSEEIKEIFYKKHPKT